MTGTQKRSSDPYARYQRSVDERRNLGWVIGGGAVALVAVLALVAFLLTRGGDEEVTAGTGAAAAKNATQETATVTIQGQDLPAYPQNTTTMLADPASDPAVGTVIPKLTGESFDGSEVVVDPADGTPKVIVFLAHWCPHCQAEVPLLQDYIDQGRLPDGVEMVAVSTAVSSDRPNYPPSRWLAREGWQPAVLLDDESGSAATAFGLPGFPYFVMVDGAGRVVQRGSGEVPIEEFDAAVQRLASSSGATTTVAGG